MEMTESDLEMKQSKSKLPLMWKDLLEHIESTRIELQAQIGVLEGQLEAKANELRGVDKLIEEKLKELESGKYNLDSLKLLIQEHEEELSIKEKRFSDVQRWVGEKEREYDLIEQRIKDGTKRFQECEEEIFLMEKQFSDVQRLVAEKEREHDVIEKLIQNRTQRLNSFEKTLEEKSRLVEFREKELKGVRRKLEKCSQKIELKERQLNEIMWSTEELKEKKMQEAERASDECDKEIKLKEEKLSLIQKSIVECSNTLKLREKQIRIMVLTVKDFCLHKKTMEEWSCKLGLKEKQFESNVEELHKRINEGLDEVQLKVNKFDSLEEVIRECEKHFDSQEKLLQECSNGLEMKERKLEQLAKELELKQQQIDLIRKSTEEECPANNAGVPSSRGNQSSIKRNGKSLQLIINEHLKKIDLLSSELSAHLKTSSDPAELVLDAMQGFYPSTSVDNMKFDFELTVIRTSCVLLLQELKRLSPQINSQLREEAIKLAAEWKAKMTVAAENSMEILGFLWLLTAFELTSTYNASELQSLLAIVALREHTTELVQALGIIDKAPPGKNVSFPVKIEEPESSPVGNVATPPSPNLQRGATTYERNSQGCLDERLSGNHSVQNKMFDYLHVSIDPGRLALTMMQKSLSEYWRKGGLEATVMMRYISMLEELMQVLPHAGSHLKEDAVELAVQWKAKMRACPDNSLEIFCFLKFIAAYGLGSTFNAYEMVKFLGMISQHEQAPELLQTLGFADKIADFIWNLIEKKQRIEAVKFICTFNLIDKFPPALLLKEHVEDARQSCWIVWQEKESCDEKDKVVDDQIAVLRAVIQCIKDYKIESEYPSKGVETQIVLLEKLKVTWRNFGRTTCASKQELAKRKNSSTSTSASNFQPPEKRQAIAAARPCLLPTFTSGYPQLILSSQLSENYGHPGQLSMAANNHEAGADFGAPQLNSSSVLYENYGHPMQFGMAANVCEIGASSGAMPPLSLSSPLFENYGHPAGFRVAANNQEIGADLSARQNATLHHSDQFVPITHSYGPK